MAQTVTLNFQPTPIQTEVLRLPQRHQVWICGRRWGKTAAAAAKMVRAMIADPGIYWWVAPTYKQGRFGKRWFKRIVPADLREEHKADGYFDFAGSELWFLSADNPDSLRGEGIKGAVLEEYALMGEDAWDQAIRPTLSDHRGWSVMVTTPRGQYGPAFLAANKGLDPEEANWITVQLPSWTNAILYPHGEADPEIMEVRKDLPDIAFRQEYGAEFLAGGASVFGGLDLCKTAAPCEHDGPYVAGVDLAKWSDYTVMVVACATCGCRRMIWRINQRDWTWQCERIRDLAKEWRCHIVLDSTGVGDATYDLLRKMGVDCEGYKLTSDSKHALVEGHMLAVESQAVKYPQLPGMEVLIREMQIFAYSFGKSGRVSYSAPPGYHDDCVIADALATYAIGKRKAPAWVFGGVD